MPLGWIADTPSVAKATRAAGAARPANGIEQSSTKTAHLMRSGFVMGVSCPICAANAQRGPGCRLKEPACPGA
jgi:hypothetical protein